MVTLFIEFKIESFLAISDLNNVLGKSTLKKEGFYSPLLILDKINY